MWILHQLQGWGRLCWEPLGSCWASVQGSIPPSREELFGVSWCAQHPGKDGAAKDSTGGAQPNPLGICPPPLCHAALPCCPEQEGLS